ncbi:MAG TPA: class I SAM-dependent methyltransferase [Gemmataceae bacterium]|nr:class I SAM-dependent methyltransferase [Gemmataceae bacterium]
MRSPAYLLTSTRKYLLRQGLHCPSCGHRNSHVHDRKWLVTTLRRCGQCALLFRAPTTTAAENARLYQSVYREGFTTDMPDDARLDELVARDFRASDRDHSTYLDVLAALGGQPGLRVFDFGCSWGYGSYQLRRAGYKVDAFEISVPRATFAREKLGVPIVPPDKAEPGHYDIFFSSHVIEHVPSVESMLTLGMRLLRPGGIFVAFTPNGGELRRRTQYATWHRCWGFVHPQLLDEVYLAKRFAGYRYVIATNPYPLVELRRFPHCPSVLDQSGMELMFAVEKAATDHGRSHPGP